MENLWNDVIPYWNEEFIEADETAARKPTITAYPANSKGAVIIFPGGGYVIRADHEGTAYAKWLQSMLLNMSDITSTNTALIRIKLQSWVQVPADIWRPRFLFIMIRKCMKIQMK